MQRTAWEALKTLPASTIHFLHLLESERGAMGVDRVLSLADALWPSFSDGTWDCATATPVTIGRQ